MDAAFELVGQHLVDHAIETRRAPVAVGGEVLTPRVSSAPFFPVSRRRSATVREVSEVRDATAGSARGANTGSKRDSTCNMDPVAAIGKLSTAGESGNSVTVAMNLNPRRGTVWM